MTQATPAATWHPPARSIGGNLAIAGCAGLAILGVLYAWNLPPFAGGSQDTDDAAVRGRVTVISPQVSGYVTVIPVPDFGRVRAGTVLARIDDRIYRARLAQAEANLAAKEAALANSDQAERAGQAAVAGQQAGIANAAAQLARARADMARADALVADGSISAREHDQTRAALLQAEAALRQASATRTVGTENVASVRVGRGGLAAAVAEARAQVRLAAIDFDNTVIRAPADGQLSELGVREGAYVTPGTQLMFLVPDARWVIANFKEVQTRTMHVGQRAVIAVDALGGVRIRGHVESIAPAAGSEFALLKPDNATGNYVKVAQRLAVRITIDSNQPVASRLRPGLSVEATVLADRP